MDRRSIVGGGLAACLWSSAVGSQKPAKEFASRCNDIEKGDVHPVGLTLMVIRHAEKPDNPALGPGLSSQGEQHERSLVVRGWQRAGAWAMLFGSGSRQAEYPTPDVVFAVNPNANANEKGLVSRRPYETVLPLCQKLGAGPILDFGIGDEAAMLNVATKKRGVVLICWEHNRIVDAILPGLAKQQRIPGLPSHWDEARFDVALRFDRLQSGAPWVFRQLFPKLLAGDLDVSL